MSRTQAIFFCLCSFILGIAGATYYFNNLPKQRLDTFQMEFTPPKDVNSINVQNQITLNKKETKVLNSTTNNYQISSSPKQIKDFFNLTSQVKSFSRTIYAEVEKRFKRGSSDPSERAFQENILKADLVGRTESGMFWLKSSLSNNNSKFYFFYKDYKCSEDILKIPTKPALNDACYLLYVFFFYKGRWHEWTTSSTFKGFLWEDRMPYILISLSDLEEFAKDTTKTFLVLSAPPGGYTSYFQKFKDGKFSWEETSAPDWYTSSKKEMEAFGKKIDRSEFDNQQ